MVADLPPTYAEVLGAATGAERQPDLAWSVAEYTCHVADNLRIWAERLMGVAGGGPLLVGAYDEMALATARDYRSIPLPGALWSLSRSVGDWLDAVDGSGGSGVALVHPDRGDMSLADVTLSNAHDGVHHRWDIARILRR
jgi:hypothetical protein